MNVRVTFTGLILAALLGACGDDVVAPPADGTRLAVGASMLST